MAKFSRVAGATSQSVGVFIQDSSKTNGAGLTGLVFNTSSLIAYYTFSGANTTAVAIPLVTLAAVTTAWASGGFKEIDATHTPGLYRLDIPNAALAASKGNSVVVYLSGATNMAPCVFEIELTAVDNQSTGFALSNVSANVTQWLSNAVAASSSSGIPDVNVITVAGGASNIKKNQALASFMFLMTDSTNHAPATGLTVTPTRSLDGGAFGSTANAVTEVSGGWYKISLANTDTNCNVLALRFTATGADDRDITIITQP